MTDTGPNSHGAGEPLALVGMGCRFPGGASTPEAFWKLLVDGVDATCEVPPDRWDADAYHDPDKSAPGKADFKRGGYLTEPVDTFDARFFNISGKECQDLDPQQRLLLEVCWEALEHAGLDVNALAGSRTGVWLGYTGDDYALGHRHSGHLDRIGPYSLTGTSFSTASGRVSYTFGFEGPAMTVDTACSSSLVALHLACRSLADREADMALVAGVSLMLTPSFSVCSTKLGTTSSDGRSKAFDASADGYGRGEGCGVLVVKRLSDALRDGDRVLARILSTATNQDGRSSGLTAPSPEAQKRLMAEALAKAGLGPDGIDYMEAHGTGTPVGDPVEMESIGAVLGQCRTREDPLVVGSVKANIGHLEPVAGVAGVMKAALVLQHGLAPKQVLFRNPTPAIDWDRLPVKVPTANTVLPDRGRPLRAAVNSFGFSGSNAHAILEQHVAEPAPARPESPIHVLPVSAKSGAAAQELARLHAGALEDGHGPSAADACHTAALGRGHFEHRLAVAGADRGELAERLRARAAEAPAKASGAPRVAFLFTGQGSQYPFMGKGIYESHPGAAEVLDSCAEWIRENEGWSLLDVLFTDNERIHQSRYTQPAILSLQMALMRVWSDWGVTPCTALGHSLGEYGVAVAAGVLDAGSALRLICARGRQVQELPGNGAMLAVLAPERELLEAAGGSLPAGVVMATINAPDRLVVSGPAPGVQSLQELLEARQVSCVRLPVSHAFHSAQMDPMEKDFFAVASRVAYRDPAFPMLSTVLGGWAGNGDLATAEYWCRQIRMPVLFMAAALEMARGGVDVCLEIGPKPTLVRFMQRLEPIMREQGMSVPLFLESLAPDRDDWQVMGRSLAALYEAGADVDWRGVHAPYAGGLADLPRYAFQRTRYWKDLNWGHGTAFQARADAGLEPVHPLLGRRVESPALRPGVTAYTATYDADSPAWLKDHVIYGRIICPGAAFVCQALAAGMELYDGRPFDLEEMDFLSPLVLAEGSPRTVQVLLEPRDGGGHSFSVVSRPLDGGEWTTHSRCRLAAQAQPLEVDSSGLRRQEQQAVAEESLYQEMGRLAYAVGPTFRCVRRSLMLGDTALCRVGLTPEAEAQSWRGLHPGLVDSFFHGALSVTGYDWVRGEDNGVIIPQVMGRIRYAGSLGSGEFLCRHKVDVKQDHVGCFIEIFDEAGSPRLVFEKFVCARVNEAHLYRGQAQDLSGLLFSLRWTEDAADGPAPDLPAACLALAQEAEAAQPLVSVLEERGVPCLVRAVHADPLSDGQGDALAGEFLDLCGQGRGLVLMVAPGAGTEASPDAVREHETRLAWATARLVQVLARRNALHRVACRLVTVQAQAVGDEPRVQASGSGLWGLGRVACLEFPELDLAMADLDGGHDRDGLARLVRALMAPARYANLALRQGRLFRGLLAAKPPAASPPPLRAPSLGPDEAWLLDPGRRGSFDDLGFTVRKRRTPGPGEVELRVRAVGVNFRDVLNLLGQYPGKAGDLGFDCAGDVVAVGPGVEEFRAGDAVLGMMGAGAMSSHATGPARFVFAKPSGISHEQAATLPATFVTAAYALRHLAGMRAGESLLVHAGAGGVGQAAVQLAQLAGVEVLATAGSDAKRSLLRSMGVRHVFSSRSLDFAQGVMEATGGRGVDMVLNSLSGDFVPAGLSVLAKGGRFLEMGKLGVWTPEQAREAHPHVAYHIFDVNQVAAQDPDLIRSLFLEVLDQVEAGVLRPLPLAAFEPGRAPDAFRYMAKARHVGKVVLSDSGRARQERLDRSLVRAHGTYLVTGGLGALGLGVAQWLAGHGAGRIVLLGRSGPGPEAVERIRALAESGALVESVACDVADAQGLARVLERLREQGPPLAGVVHAAGLLEDAMLLQLTREGLDRVMRPKVAGAWNLHRATMGDDLDFFVLFSSISGLLGNPGQANYAAANAWLDSLAAERSSQGLAALSVAWGPFAGSGMAAQTKGGDFSAQGLGSLSLELGLAALERAIREGMTQVGACRVDWRRFAERNSLLETPGALEGLVGRVEKVATAAEAQPEARDVRSLLGETAGDDRRRALLRHLEQVGREVLEFDADQSLDQDEPLSDQGFDSLLAVEFRNKLGRVLGASLPPTLLFDHPSLGEVADFLLAEVLPDNGGPEAGKGEDGPTPAPEPVDDTMDLLREIGRIID